MKVKGKVVLVTGGGSGIGRELVLSLLAKGAAVAAVDIKEEALDETKRLAGPLSDSLSLHQLDISNRDAVAGLPDEVIKRHGCIDAIINNAGIIHPFKPVYELDFGVIERVINVNLYGVINITKMFLPLLLKRPEAHIANVSSMGGLFAFPGQTFYGASKAAVKLLSEGLYLELRDTNVGVTVIYPGAVDTNITRNCDAHNAQLDKASNGFRGTSPQVAAAKIIRGIEGRRSRVVIGIDAKIMSVLYRISPTLALALVSRIMKLVLKD